ncbi:MAG TPA: hypothetical protein DGB72_06490 [Gemmatimonadetes bacterium]|nr:hypothetical protein [Gemmatimonadota bacterium]
MPSPLRILFIAGAGAVMAACATDNATSPVASSRAAAALVSAPLSFGATNSSFVGNSAPTNAFVPTGMAAGESSGDHGGPGWGEFMGGGIGEAFIGGLGFGPGIGKGPFENFGRREADDSDSEESDAFDHSDNCAFSATTNRVECATITHDGLTITRSFSFLDASGAVQQAFDTAKTNTVNIKKSVSGTITHHETVTSTVNGSSDLTVSGLASGSTQRTVDGTSAGTDATTGTRDGVAFTASRSAGDTTTALVIPIQKDQPTYPTAGTIVRSMTATVTLTGQTPSTSSRREVITFDGSATAKVVITHDGVTKNCTKPLPHGRLTCA